MAYGSRLVDMLVDRVLFAYLAIAVQILLGDLLSNILDAFCSIGALFLRNGRNFGALVFGYLKRISTLFLCNFCCIAKSVFCILEKWLGCFASILHCLFGFVSSCFDAIHNANDDLLV